MKKRIKDPTDRPKIKKREPAQPCSDAALPLLLCTVAFAVCFVTLIINKFVYPIGKELLSPVLLQLIALLIPSYLAIMLRAQDKGTLTEMRGIGFVALRAEYIFFVLFASLFAVCASLALTLMLGGAYDASRGLMLLGSFTAGENEYSVSLPYLVLTYAIIPAIAEEFFFRGVVFSRLEEISLPFAAAASTLLYALYGFSVGGLIPSLFVGILSLFVLYTARSLWACMLLHFLFNIYRLFLEANISAYFLSSQNNILLIITVALALCISALLFFSECARIFRLRSERVRLGEEKSENKLFVKTEIYESIRSVMAHRPSLVFSAICALLFAATVVINYII